MDVYAHVNTAIQTVQVRFKDWQDEAKSPLKSSHTELSDMLRLCGGPKGWPLLERHAHHFLDIRALVAAICK